MATSREIGHLIDTLRETAETLRETIVEAKGRRGEIQGRLTAARAAVASAQDDVDVLEQVVALLQGMEEAWQRKFQDSVAQVISRGLSLVFDEPIKLLIVPKVRADVTTVDLRIIQGEGKGQIETGLMGAKGGTMIALVNVLLRALLILSATPPLRRILVLDEPFGQADPHYIPAFGELLRELGDRLGFQVIIVSHEAALVDVADVAYEIQKGGRDGATFRRLRSKNEVRA